MFLSQRMDADGLIHRYEITRFLIYWTIFPKPDTKNHKSRCVKAPVEIMEEFKIARSNANSKYVFCQINGEMHTPSSFRSAWNSYLCKLNYQYGIHDDNIASIYNPNGIPFTIDKITPHMLRHTYATLLYSSDVDVLTASQLLGHSDINTTLKIYTHLEEMKFDKSIDKFDYYVSRMYSKIK